VQRTNTDFLAGEAHAHAETVPHRIVVSDRGLAEGNLEYKSRQETEAQAVPVAEILSFIQARISR
jgi:prolyl-tRNA synthetase